MPRSRAAAEVDVVVAGRAQRDQAHAERLESLERGSVEPIVHEAAHRGVPAASGRRLACQPRLEVGDLVAEARVGRSNASRSYPCMSKKAMLATDCVSFLLVATPGSEQFGVPRKRRMHHGPSTHTCVWAVRSSSPSSWLGRRHESQRPRSDGCPTAARRPAAARRSQADWRGRATARSRCGG